MAIAAKDGFIADFKIGYNQLAVIEPLTEVMGGTDEAYDGSTGFAVARLVVLSRLADGSAIIAAPTGVTATSIGDATHIISQSDDSLRNDVYDGIKTERYTTRPTNVLKNTADGLAPTATTATMKAVALYKITDADDIKIIPVTPVTTSVVR